MPVRMPTQKIPGWVHLFRPRFLTKSPALHPKCQVSTPVPTQLEVNPPDLDTSVPDPPPMLVEQTKPPLPNPPESSSTAVSGLRPAPPLGLPAIPTTSTAIQSNDQPNTYPFTGVMNGLKEVCRIMTTGFQHACLDVEKIVHKSLEGATQLNRNITEAAAQDLNTWASALQPVLDSAGVSDADMEARWGLARKTGWEISNRILSLVNPVVRNQPGLGEPVKTALLESFAVANAQCSRSWEEVADRIPDIMTRHVPVDQTPMFLAAVHQLLCIQYQAITTMVATQTGPPVCLGMYNWGTQASLTRLLAQAIPALGSLAHAMLVNPSSGIRSAPQPQEGRSTQAASADTTVYTPIPPPGNVMVPKSQFPSGTIWGSSSLPICLGNETDSGLLTISHATLVKSKGIDRHLNSTPKSQLKLIKAACQLTAKLSTKQQGAPHGAHVLDHGGSAQTGWGEGLRGWHVSCKIRNASLDSSLVSTDDHTQLSTKHLMERDDPTQNRSTLSGEEDILSVDDSSGIEMMSIVDLPERHSRDSAPNSGSEGEGEHSACNPSSNGHPESNQESDSRNEGSQSGYDSGSSSDSLDSDDNDEFGDMFSKPVKRKPESWAQSNSHSWSRELEPHKRALMPSPENQPNPDKLEWKKKKSSSGKSGILKGASNPDPGVVNKMAQQIGEDLIWDLQEKDDQDRQSRPKKTKKDSDREAKKAAREKEQAEEQRKQKKKRKKEKEAKERKEKEEQEAKE